MPRSRTSPGLEGGSLKPNPREGVLLVLTCSRKEGSTGQGPEGQGEKAQDPWCLTTGDGARHAPGCYAGQSGFLQRLPD